MNNGIIVKFLKSTTGLPVPYYRNEAGNVITNIKDAYVTYRDRSELEAIYKTFITEGIIELITVTGDFE